MTFNPSVKQGEIGKKSEQKPSGFHQLKGVWQLANEWFVSHTLLDCHFDTDFDK
jgi:hypothetical protein